MAPSVESSLNDKELKVLDLVSLAGWEGKTTDEMEVETGWTHQCVSARVSELWHKHNLIAPRGASRKTRTGRTARIYVLRSLLEADRRRAS
jgi:hypothetical protein